MPPPWLGGDEMKLDHPKPAVNPSPGGPMAPWLPNNMLQRLKKWSVPFGQELAVFEPEPLLGPLQAGFRSIR
jgi:hypothetical protein